MLARLVRLAQLCLDLEDGLETSLYDVEISVASQSHSAVC
jgi:hypothetical protein